MNYILRLLQAAITGMLAIGCMPASADEVLADEDRVLALIDKQLTELKTYRYERSGDPVREMERTIFHIPADSPLRIKIEQKLIDALEDSNITGRGVICRQLRVVGTDKCVPAISPLLTDPSLAIFARYALHGIGSDAALRAMYEALDSTSGTLRVGLINSLAECDYEPLRADCIRLIDSNDALVVTAAVRALGMLGGAESVDALIHAKGNAREELVADIDIALVDTAEELVFAGDLDKAARVYRLLYEDQGPFRLAALRGLVAAAPDRAADLLVQAMRNGDPRLVMSAINLMPQVTAENATEVFLEVFDELPTEPKSLFLKALGERGERSAATALIEASASDDLQIRTAAIEALGGLSGIAVTDTLIEVAATGDNRIQSIARVSLARVDSAEPRLAEIAKDSKEDKAVEAIRALASRNATGHAELIFRLARDDSQRKRIAAIDALGRITDADSVDSLIQLAFEAETAEDLPSLERSLGRVLLRMDSPADRAQPILDVLMGASKQVRPLLIRQLAKSGTDVAIEAVRDALQSTEIATSDAAVVALANWPNMAAGKDLVVLIESARTRELRTIALDGYIQIASASDDPSAMFLDALELITDLDNKKRVLNEIGLNCESLEAAAATQSLLQDSQLKSVAAIATIRIAYKLRSSHKEEARSILESVLAKVDHPDVQRRAQDVLNDLDKYEDHILQWVAVGPFVDPSISSGKASYDKIFKPETANSSDQDWKPLTKGIGSWDINLEAEYGPRDHCSAYVRTMVWSPVDQDVQIESGSDDALKIWVNGIKVHEQWRIGGGGPRQFLVPARLEVGWNELKLKVTDHEGGWHFGCRVREPNGSKLDGLKYEAR